MSSFSNVSMVRQIWRPATYVAGWVTGTVAVACVAAAVVLGGATAAVQRAGNGIADPAEAWITVVSLLAVGLVLAGAAYLLFSASESRSEESAPGPAALRS
jgi:hypothetical protein